MFDLTKEISLKHKNAYDLLDSEVKDIAGYGIIDQEEISNSECLVHHSCIYFFFSSIFKFKSISIA
jgi:hypothetical protein